MSDALDQLLSAMNKQVSSGKPIIVKSGGKPEINQTLVGFSTAALPAAAATVAAAAGTPVPMNPGVARVAAAQAQLRAAAEAPLVLPLDDSEVERIHALADEERYRAIDALNAQKTAYYFGKYRENAVNYERRAEAAEEAAAAAAQSVARPLQPAVALQPAAAPQPAVALQPVVAAATPVQPVAAPQPAVALQPVVAPQPAVAATPVQSAATALQSAQAPVQPVVAPAPAPAAAPRSWWSPFSWGRPAAPPPAAAAAAAPPTAQQLEAEQRRQQRAAAAAAYAALPAEEIARQEEEDRLIEEATHLADVATQEALRTVGTQEGPEARLHAQKLQGEVGRLLRNTEKRRQERLALIQAAAAPKPPRRWGFWGGRKTGRKRRSIHSRPSRKRRG